ncbi:tRNA (adenosine(37)-N6)-dimethylallyltransferase MiaA [Candidatus Dojkabacteria bacterium]|nr:tRNA (adenosine(37)-N6)-dimethylallyltransferase MiaA [Candidatus Dojkabacteria bacterium]
MNSQNRTQKIIVIGGPTASGKTELALMISKIISAEIINADSVQVYKYLNIGSNKGKLTRIATEMIDHKPLPVMNVDNSDMKGHLFSFVEPDVNFTLYDYYSVCSKLILNFNIQKKIPILVGGTGLYIDSILNKYNLPNIEIDTTLRNKLNKMEVQDLQKILREKDSTVYFNLNNSDKNNPRRLIRLIEKINTDSKNKNTNNPLDSIDLDSLFIYPKFQKSQLMKKINERVVQMFEDGFVSEVEGLIDMGYDLHNKAMQSTGYKQIYEMLLGIKDESIKECIQRVQNAHKQYAKRQITWFEGEGRGYDLIKTDSENLEQIVMNFI